MSKKRKIDERLNVGVDVSKQHLEVCWRHGEGEPRTASVENTLGGWKKLQKLLKSKGPVRVVMEATGTYHLDCAVFLHGRKNIEVMVVNPRVARDFARARMKRAKTDKVDAAALCEFARSMEFVCWQPPRAEILEIRAMTRRITSLKDQAAAEKNRLEATQVTDTTPKAVLDDIHENLAALEQRIAELSELTIAVIRRDPEISAKFAQLVTIKGVANTSALMILSELLVLPSDMTVEQWVAHCGLDPRPYQSGTSVNRPTRISRTGNARLRSALYFPAISAKNHDPHVRAFAAKLTSRNLKPLQVVVAVMRKLLHAIYGMLKTGTNWDGAKFYATPAGVPVENL